MKLEVVNGLVGFVGKNSELSKINHALDLFRNRIEHRGFFDNGDEDCNLVDLSLGYDMEDYTVDDLKHIWRVELKPLMKGIK
jgi:hypothetical protein